MILHNILISRGNKRRTISGYQDEDEAIAEAQALVDSGMLDGARVEVETVTSPWYKPPSKRSKSKRSTNPRRNKRAPTAKRYMGHDYRKTAKGWEVLPYGAKVATEADAKAWIRAHVRQTVR